MRREDLYILVARGMGLISEEEHLKLQDLPGQDILAALKAKLSEGEVKRLEKTFLAAAGEIKVAGRQRPDVQDDSHHTNTLNREGGSEPPPVDKEKFISVAPPANQTFDITPEAEDRYCIKKEQGRGGIGRVLLAFDQHIGRNVALKELLKTADSNVSSPDAQDRTALEEKQIRFLKEARITGQLQHPSIVPVHEIGRREDGTYYYTMKLVEGRTLSQAIAECESIEDRLKLLPHFRDMCQAIAFAHSCGVIHRDIKPSNVMIGEFGQTVVLDWGIAKLLDEIDEGSMDGQQLIQELGGSETVEGSTLGTPAYMSPEQTRGELHEVDELSDVYSLGACLYEILSGRSPYTGSHVWEIILKVLCEPVRPLEEESSPPPRELAAIAYKALAKEREDRYQSAVELAGAVEAYMSGEKVAAYEYSSIELLKRFASKNKVMLVAAGVVLFALVFGLISNSTALSKERESNQQMKAAVRLEQESNQQMKAAVRLEKDAKREAYFHMAQGFGREAGLLEKKNRPLGAKIYAAASLVHNPANRQSPYFHPEFARQHPLSLRVRAEAAARIYEARHRDALELEGMIPTVDPFFGNPASPDGQLVAVAGADNKIVLWNVKTKKQVGELVGHEDRVYTLEFSPDGGTIFSGSNDGTVRAFDIRSRRQLWRVDFPGGGVYDVAVSADGKWMAAAGLSKEIQLLEPKTGNLVREFKGHQKRVHGLSFSPDGKTLASGSFDTTVRLWEVETGKLVATMEGHRQTVMSLSFAHDHRHLASGSYDGNIRIWDVKSRESPKVLEGFDESIWGLDFSPDDTQLVSAAGGRNVRIWDTETGVNVSTFQAHKNSVYGAYFFGAGDRLVSVSVDKTLKIWEIKQASPIVALEGHSMIVWGVKYSGDGKRLASASLDKTVRVWDAESHELLGVLGDHGGTVYCAAFSPDNKQIASGGVDRKVRIWDANTFEKLFELDGHDGLILSAVFSRDGAKLATSGADKTIRLWDTRGQKELQVFKGHTGVVWGVFFSKGDSRLVSVGADSTIRLWDVDSGVELRRVDTSAEIKALDATQDEKWLFTSSKDRRITMWELSTLKKIREFVGHEQSVNYLAVTPDGSTLASSSDDNTVRLWSVSIAEPLLIFSGTQQLGLDFSPDGRTLAASDGNSIKLFPVDLSLDGEDPQTLLTKFERASGLTLKGFMLENMEPSEIAEALTSP